MDIPHLERRLGAVLVAVVGFSRHMERNEAATFSRLREVRERVIDPKLALHAGRLIKSTGDGVLVEFPSALAALRAAIEIQRDMGVRNLYLAPDARFEFRIGINLGDIKPAETANGITANDTAEHAAADAIAHDLSDGLARSHRCVQREADRSPRGRPRA